MSTIQNKTSDIENRPTESINNSTQSNQSTQTKSTTCLEYSIISVMAIFSALVVLVVLGLFFALPIAEIVMAEKFRGDMSCPDGIISPYTWMLTEGIVGIFIYGMLGLTIILAFQKSDIANGFAVAFVVPTYLLLVFQFCWIIVGAVMFWRDCVDLETHSMNNFYWAVLIINLVMIWCSATSIKNED